VTSEIELSIVVAASDSQDAIAECLGALEPQLEGRAAEVFCVGAPSEAAKVLRERFQAITWIPALGEALTPERWSLGARQARGRIIAFTISTCVPDSAWVAEMLRAHADRHAAIGGAIESAAGSGLVDWAVCFVRYTPYMLPFPAGPGEVPGDNGSYKRDALADQMPWIEAYGFWEQTINANLRRQKQSLWQDPRIVVYCKKPFTLAGFSRQRFEHGCIFGRMRGTSSAGPKRLFYLLTSPAIPLVYLARITQGVIRKKRHRASFALSLPITIWFLYCWSAGEFRGLLRG
jgi:hypothetical protein